MTHDPTDVALLEAHQAAAAQAAAVELQTEIGDFKWTVSNKRGRRYIMRRLEQAGVFRLSFTSDPYLTAFNEGQRNDGLKVLAMLMEHAPESYALMLTEHNDNRRNTRTER